VQTTQGRGNQQRHDETTYISTVVIISSKAAHTATNQFDPLSCDDANIFGILFGYSRKPSTDPTDIQTDGRMDRQTTTTTAAAATDSQSQQRPVVAVVVVVGTFCCVDTAQIV
jgi:hypothetical protein